VDSLTYWNVVAAGLPWVLIVFRLIAWRMHGWLPIWSVDEVTDNQSWTIADIPIEEIWPDLDDEAQALCVNFEEQLL
jgi:hypothetical protein